VVFIFQRTALFLTHHRFDRSVCQSVSCGHEFDLLGSRDVIGYVTIRLVIGYFLLVVRWNQASIFNGF